MSQPHMPLSTRWLVAQYAAGLLPPAGRLLAECYLELNPAMRAAAAPVEAVGGWALEMAPAAELASCRTADALLAQVGICDSESDARGRCAADRAEGADARLPMPLRDIIGRPLSALDWSWRSPGAHEYRIPALETGQIVARLLRIEPGKAIPQHTHTGLEATLVLDGAYSDAAGRFARGDLELADASTDHKPVAEPGAPCLCFAVSDAPLRLTGPVGRVVDRLLLRR